MSPTGECIVIGKDSKIIYLESKYNYDTQENIFDACWSLDLSDLNESITAVLCIPLIGQSAGSDSATDWSCIVIGTSSGTVHFYTDSRIHLLSQTWNNGPVRKIKAQSGKYVHEEIHILYENCVSIVEGYNLFPTLRTARQNHIKSATLRSNLLTDGVQYEVPCRKWSFSLRGDQKIYDSSVVGSQKVSTFDHLLSASIENGPSAKYRAAPPQNSLVIGIGIKPYIGYYFAKEGFSQPVFQDIARMATSLIKSALP